ncbi:hypothetical protein TRIUR3_31123 [Triticum urartu]|uniref:Uncharacterized protein n=1 Tax=Triticum urartu TaxID=4572 RepID=M7YLI4_TRIUA|nr:hypothetical protein TRIUR3_31123 [Triticum urartu]
MDAGAAPAPLVGPLRHRPGPPALHHPPTAPTRPTGSAHVSNSSCYSTCSGFHLLKISSIVTSASFYLAFTDQWFNPSPPYFHYSSILARFQGRGSLELSYFVSLLSRGALDLEAFFLKYAFVVKERCCCVNLCRCVELGGGFPVKKKVSYKLHPIRRALSCSTIWCREALGTSVQARYLSRWDIQVALRSGCLIIYRKAINSRKRLRAHVGLDEGEVCPK